MISVGFVDTCLMTINVQVTHLSDLFLVPSVDRTQGHLHSSTLLWGNKNNKINIDIEKKIVI